MARVPQGRVTIFGTLSDGADVWNTSFAVDPLAAKSDTNMQGAATQILANFVNHFWSQADVAPYFSEKTALVGVRLDDVRDPGGVVRTKFAYTTEPIVGTSVANQMPPETSACVSLRTGLPGPRYRGRMYLPPMQTGAINPSGNIGFDVQDNLAQQMAAFFTGVNGDAAAAVTCFVASDAAQQLTPIIQVQVGSVFDSQRRRRNSIPEAYITYDVAL